MGRKYTVEDLRKAAQSNRTNSPEQAGTRKSVPAQAKREYTVEDLRRNAFGNTTRQESKGGSAVFANYGKTSQEIALEKLRNSTWKMGSDMDEYGMPDPHAAMRNNYARKNINVDAYSRSPMLINAMNDEALDVAIGLLKNRQGQVNEEIEKTMYTGQMVDEELSDKMKQYADTIRAYESEKETREVAEEQKRQEAYVSRRMNSLATLPESARELVESYNTNEELHQESVHNSIYNRDGMQDIKDLKYIEAMIDAENKLKEEYGIEGEKLDKILQYAREVSDVERTQALQGQIRTDIKEHPVAAGVAYTAMDILMSPVAGISAATESLKAKTYADKDAPVNTNSPEYSMMNISNATEQAVNEQIDNPVGQFAYNVGTSMGKSALAAGIGGAVVGALGLSGTAAKVVGNLITLPQFGASAYASTLQEDQTKGISAENATKHAIASGVGEMMFEVVSLDKLWDIAGRTGKVAAKQVLKDALVQAGIEGSEEGFTSIWNHVADNVINGSQSDYNMNVAAYMQNGYTEEEARAQASKDFYGEVVMDVLAGAASGGIMGGGANAIAAVNYHNLGKYVDGNTELKQAVYDAAQSMSEESTTRQFVKDKGVEDLSGEDMANVIKAMSEESEKDTEQILQERFMELGETKQQAKANARSVMEAVTTDSEDVTEAEHEARNAEFASNENLVTVYAETLKGELTKPQDAVRAAQESYVSNKHYEGMLNRRMTNRTGVARATIKSTGENAIVVDIKDISNGSATVRMSDNSYRDLGEIEIQDAEMQALYNFATTMEDVKAANAVIEEYNGQSLASYAEACAVFYNAGKVGATSFESLMNNQRNSALVSNMSSPATLKLMYTMGENNRTARKAKVAPVQPEQNAKKTVVHKKGSVIDNRTDKTDGRMLKIVEQVAKKTGLELTLNDSLSHGENGHFQKALSRIALSSESNNQYATLVHEINEFAELYNPEGMKKVIDTVLDYAQTKEGAASLFGKDNGIIQRYQNAYERVEAGKTYEDAAEEFVFDYLSGVFSSKEGVEDFSRYMTDTGIQQKEQKGILQTIADFFKELADIITSYLDEHVLSSAAKKGLQADADKAQEIRRMVMEVWQQAEERYHTRKLAQTVDIENEAKYSVYMDEHIRQKAEQFKKEGYSKFERVKVSKVSEKMAKDVERLVGFDATGYEVYSTTDTYKHIEKRHGENGSQDHSMQDMRDVALIPYVLEMYDNAELVLNQKGEPEYTNAYSDKNGKPSKMIKFSKKIGGIQHVVVATPENKYNRLWVLSGYIEQKKDTSQASYGISSLPPTSLTNSDNVSSNNSVSQNSENATPKYSLSVDSLGRELTSEQKQYFANSKVVDENGNLVVVYHGTRSADFNVFRRNVNFFTDSKEMADSYAPNSEMYEGYVKIENPYVVDAKGERWSGIPIDDELREFLVGYGSSVFKEGGKWRTTPADIAAAIEEAVDDGDMDYDGIIIKNVDDTGSYGKGSNVVATDYIVFNSNQFKNVSNMNPTDDADIRYSISADKKTSRWMTSTGLQLPVESLTTGSIDSIQQNSEKSTIKYSIGEIIDSDGNNYGMGVVLDSDLLTGLTEKERKQMVKLRVVEELAGNSFIAYDGKKPIEISIAKRGEKFKNRTGKRNLVLRELYNKNSGNKTKQEAVILADELVEISEYEHTEASKYSHDWLDNYGLNDWEKRTVYLQDKNKTIFEAILNIANSKDGRKILYDIDPIKKVKGGIKSPTTITNNKIAQKDGKVKYSIDIDDSLFEALQDTYSAQEQEFASIVQEGFASLKKVTVNERVMHKVAYDIKKAYKSGYDIEKLQENLTRVFAYLKDNADNVGYEDMVRIVQEIAKPVIEQSTDVDAFEKEIYNNFRSYLKGKTIRLSDEQKAEVAYYYGSYENFRKKNFGNITFSDEGTYLDNIWTEICDNAYEMLDRDISTADEPIALIDALNTLRPTKKNIFGMDTEQAAYDLALDIYRRFFVEQAEESANQKVNAKTQRLIVRQQEYRKRVKQEYEESLQRLREAEQQKRKNLAQKYEQKIYELKEEQKAMLVYKDVKASNAIQRKINYYQRELVRANQKSNDRILQIKASNRQNMINKRRNEEIRQYRERIKRNARGIVTMFNTNTDKKHVPEALKVPVANFITSIDFVSERASTDSMATMEWQDTLSVMYRKLSDHKAAVEGGYSEIYDALHDWEAGDKKTSSLLSDMANFIDSNSGVKISEMNIEQLRRLDELITGLKRAIANVNKLYVNKRTSSVQYLGDSTIADLSEKKDKKSRTQIGEMAENLLDVDMLDSRSYFYRLGNNAFSIYEGLRNGFSERVWMLKEAQQYMEKELDGIDVKKWTGDNAEVHTIIIKGKELKLTTGQIMALYELKNRYQAKTHLRHGGIRPSKIGKGKTAIERVTPVKLTDYEIDLICQKLTPEQRKVADAMQQFMANNCAEWGNKTSMLMYGYKRFGASNYFPIKTDGNTVDTKDDSKYFGTKNQGFTKETSKNASNAVIVSDIFDVFTKHVTDMASYSAFTAPLMDAMKWFNYKSISYEGDIAKYGKTVKQEMERTYGKQYEEYFKKLIKDINAETTKGFESQISDTLTSRMKAASVGANLRVAIQQPTAYVRAMAVMNPKYLLQAVPKKAQIEKAKENSAITQWKSWGYFETSIGMSMKNVITGQDNLRNKVVEKSMWAAQKADDITWGYLWNACEAEIKDKHPKVEYNSKEFIELVSKRFDEVVDQTQVVDSVLHRSHIMRSENGIVKMATSFMAEPTKSYNMLMNQVRDVAEGKGPAAKKNLANATVAYLVTGMLNAVIVSFVDAARDMDDDDDTYWERYAEALGENVKDNINPLSMIPYMKDIISLINGYDVSRMDMQGISNVIAGGQKLMKYIDDEGYRKDNTLLDVSKTLIRGASQVLGIPAYNLLRDIESITYTMFGVRLGGIKRKNSRNYELMVDASLSGDTEQYAEAVAGLSEREVNEDAIQEGIRKEIRERLLAGEISQTDAEQLLIEEGGWSEDEAYWKMREWKNKQENPDAGTSKYQYLYAAIDYAYETGKISDRDLMQKEISLLLEHGMTRENVITQVTGHYKPLYLEQKASGKTADMKNLLLAVYMTLGVKRDEAMKKIDSWE